ncbi:MAG: Ig-like domain-containing protein [Lachnospiraceae bacterium]|nr:Ig-like domain-containing protein [Lachnospiraceae bacterium]
MKRRNFIALLLALVMIISLAPVKTFADEEIYNEIVEDEVIEDEELVFQLIYQEDIDMVIDELNSISTLCNDENNIDEIGDILNKISGQVLPIFNDVYNNNSYYFLNYSRDVYIAEEFKYTLENLQKIDSLYKEKLIEVSNSACRDALFYEYPYGYYTVWDMFGLAENDPEKTDLFVISGEITKDGYHKITWNKLWYADKVVYELYGAPIGEKYKKLATIDETEELSYVNEVKDGKIWKYCVIPYKFIGNSGAFCICEKSTQCFLASKNSKKYTNADAISILGDEEITLTENKSKKIKTDLSKVSDNKRLYSGKKIKNVRYYSSDDGVAEVSKKGKITALSEGSCYIYAVTENGLIDYIKVNVKAENSDIKKFDYSYATKEEGINFLMSNKDYLNGFSQYDLDYKTKKNNATMDEYLEYAKDQVMEFTEIDKFIIDTAMDDIAERLAYYNLTLPEMEHITFIKTSMLEEDLGAGGYTHGTQIYIGMFNMECFKYDDYYDDLLEFLAHEIFHCLTRNNPDFRKDMYSFIHFTVQDEEFVIPPSVMEHFISNPDVGHHNSYATFNINGEDIDCFLALIALEPFENAGDSFFDSMATAIVPIDGTDIFYLPEDTSNFYDLLGLNTGYVVDPEECMADNFKFTIIHGLDWDYATPEIPEAIWAYLGGK